MNFIKDSTDPLTALIDKGVFEEENSNRLHPWELINSCLYEIPIVDYEYKNEFGVSVFIRLIIVIDYFIR